MDSPATHEGLRPVLLAALDLSTRSPRAERLRRGRPSGTHPVPQTTHEWSPLRRCCAALRGRTRSASQGSQTSRPASAHAARPGRSPPVDALESGGRPHDLTDPSARVSTGRSPRVRVELPRPHAVRITATPACVSASIRVHAAQQRTAKTSGPGPCTPCIERGSAGHRVPLTAHAACPARRSPSRVICNRRAPTSGSAVGRPQFESSRRASRSCSVTSGNGREAGVQHPSAAMVTAMPVRASDNPTE